MRSGAAFLALLLLFPMTGWVIVPVVAPQSAGTSPMVECELACARMGVLCPMMQHDGHGCSCALSHRPNQRIIGRVQAIAGELSQRAWAPSEVARESGLGVAGPLAGYPGRVDHPPAVLL